MRIGSLSKALGVPVPTVRRWTIEFARGLSDGARGAEGRPRSFNARDQHILTRARELLDNEGATYAGVREQLVREGLLPPYPSEMDEPPTPEERDAAVRFVTMVVQGLLAPLEDRLTGLERRVTELDREVKALSAYLSQGAEGPPGGPVEGFQEGPGRRRWPFR